MKKFQRIMIIQDTTMKLVAEKSLVGLSMRQVSALSGINQSMIYRDFGSKEKLLRSCYDRAKAELKDLLRKLYIEDIKCTSILEEKIRKNLELLTDALIENDYRTVYLCEYRERHLKNTGLLDPEPEGTGRDTGRGAVHESSELLHINSSYNDLSRSAFTAENNIYRDAVEHFIETAILYSKKVLHGEVKDLPQNREKIWKLLRGILKIFE